MTCRFRKANGDGRVPGRPDHGALKAEFQVSVGRKLTSPLNPGIARMITLGQMDSKRRGYWVGHIVCHEARYQKVVADGPVTQERAECAAVDALMRKSRYFLRCWSRPFRRPTQASQLSCLPKEICGSGHARKRKPPSLARLWWQQSVPSEWGAWLYGSPVAEIEEVVASTTVACWPTSVSSRG